MSPEKDEDQKEEEKEKTNHHVSHFDKQNQIVMQPLKQIIATSVASASLGVNIGSKSTTAGEGRRPHLPSELSSLIRFCAICTLRFASLFRRWGNKQNTIGSTGGEKPRDELFLFDKQAPGGRPGSGVWFTSFIISLFYTSTAVVLNSSEALQRYTRKGPWPRGLGIEVSLRDWIGGYLSFGRLTTFSTRDAGKCRMRLFSLSPSMIPLLVSGKR